MRRAVLLALSITACTPSAPPAAPKAAVFDAPPRPPPVAASWIHAVGASTRNRARAVALDASGNALIAATSSKRKAVVAKLAPDGAHLWTRSLDAAGTVDPAAIAVDPAGNVYLAGSFTKRLTITDRSLSGHDRHDILVVKFDPQGMLLWAKSFGGTAFEAARGIAVDAAGNVYLTGTYQRDLDFGGGVLDNAGVYDVFVAAFDTSGRHLWSRGYHATGGTETTGAAIAVSASAVYVAGRIDGDVDFGGGRHLRAEGASLFALKLGRDGRYVWSFLAGGRGDARAAALEPDGKGGVAIAGTFTGGVQSGAASLTSVGGSDAIVLKLDGQGVPVWSKRFGGTGYDEAHAVVVDAQGGVIVAGAVEGRIDLGEVDAGRGRSDAILVKLDAQGALRWARRYGAGGADEANGLAMDRAQGLVVVGAFAETIDAGVGTLQSRGVEDAFVLRLLAGEPPSVAAPSVEIASGPKAAADQAVHAAELGDVELLKQLVPARVPATAADANGWSLVMKAAYEGKADAVRYLIANGASPNTALPSGYTTLMQAVRFGHMDAVRALVEGGGDVNRKDAKLGTALHIAVTEGRRKVGVAAYLLAHGARVDARDGRGRTPLFMAIDSTNQDGARALLAARASVEAADGEGNTPLAWAAVKGNAAMTAELLDRGARPDVANANGMTPIFHASHGGHAAIVRALLAKGANVNVQEKKFGDTALMRAAQNGHPAVVELLLANGARPNEKNDDGLTAAHMAARNGQDGVLRVLAKHGANFRLKDQQGRDVLAAAGSRSGTASLVRSLTK